MTVQRRPLTGMVSAGVAAPRVINAAATTLHTLDQTAAQQGGTFPDLITLWVQNPTAGDVELALTVAGGTVITQTIKSKVGAVAVLDNVPFQAAATGTATITATGNLLVFWGWFARPL